MEKKEERYAFNDVVSFDTIGQNAIDKFNMLNESIYGSNYGFTNANTKELLLEIVNELDEACQLIENYIREFSYDVEYYKKQSDVLNLTPLKDQYVLNRFKMGLLACRLFYLSNIRDSVKLVLSTKREMQLKK